MKILSLKGKIRLLSGLHIGAGDDGMKIGGIDNAVIKDINTNIPYIPGSSLKGKMRSLLEWDYNLVDASDGNPFSAKYISKLQDEAGKKKALNLMRVFGSSVETKDEKILKEMNEDLGITRINISDCHITKAQTDKDKEDNDFHLSEAKMENVIDRKTGTAKHGVGARQSERVPSGIEFDFDFKLKVFKNDDEEQLKSILTEAMNLLENDYLGGSGSRGYGRIKFIDKTWA